MKYQTLLMLWTLLMTKTEAKIIDLSHNHGPDTMMSPGVPSFNRSTIFAGDYLPGVYIEGGQYSSGEHGGTHVDAPVHALKGGQRLHEIPLENTIAEGVMIDCSAEAAKDKSYMVPIKKLLDWEKQHGQIPLDAAVLFKFGWSLKFHDEHLYLGKGASDDQFTYVFPTVSAEAGLWLYDNRRIKIIGTDTLTPDPLSTNGQKVTNFPIHQKYLTNNRLIIENLNALERLPPTGFRFHASPVKYVGSTGAQVRAYAMTFDEDLNVNSAERQIGQNCFFVLFVVNILLLQR